MIEGGGGVESRLLPVKLLAAAATFSPFNQHPETSFSNSVERKALSLPSNAQIAKGPWCWYALLSLLQLRRLSPPVPWCQGILSPSPDRLWKWNFLPSWHCPCLCIVRGGLGDTLDKLNMLSLPRTKSSSCRDTSWQKQQYCSWLSNQYFSSLSNKINFKSNFGIATIQNQLDLDELKFNSIYSFRCPWWHSSPGVVGRPPQQV